MALGVTYKYDCYRNGVYLGVLPNVTSEFTYSQDINSAGSQLVVTTAQDIDTQQQPVTLLIDESSNQLTDESGNPLTTDRAPDIYGNLNQSAMIRNGNEIKVWEYTKWQPNGVLVFDGVVKRWNAHIGISDAVDLTVLSYGVELDNAIAYGANAVDQIVLNPVTNGTALAVVNSSSKECAQIFTTGPNVTSISGFILEAVSVTSATVISCYVYTYSGGNPDSGTNLGIISTTLILPSDVTQTPYAVAAIFGTPIAVNPSTIYSVVISTITTGGSATLSMSSSTYPYGNAWSYNGTTWTQQSGCLAFATLATNSSTIGFTNSFYYLSSPLSMMNDIMNNYIGAGGHVSIGSISGPVPVFVSRSFVLNTIHEATDGCLTSLPSGYYWYVDVGSSKLYLQQKSAVPDHYFTFKVHINTFELLVTTESSKNEVYLTAGNTTIGQPIIVYATDMSSVNNFSSGLERITDSRIVDVTSAQIVANNYVDVNSVEQYQSQVTLFASNYDLTTLSLGQVIGFNGFESYADTLQMMIVRLARHSDFAVLDLGTVPKRASTKAENIERALLSLQTVNNPLSAI